MKQKQSAAHKATQDSGEKISDLLSRHNARAHLHVSPEVHVLLPHLRVAADADPGVAVRVDPDLDDVPLLLLLMMRRLRRPPRLRRQRRRRHCDLLHHRPLLNGWSAVHLTIRLITVLRGTRSFGDNLTVRRTWRTDADWRCATCPIVAVSGGAGYGCFPSSFGGHGRTLSPDERRSRTDPVDLRRLGAGEVSVGVWEAVSVFEERRWRSPVLVLYLRTKRAFYSQKILLLIQIRKYVKSLEIWNMEPKSQDRPAN